MRASNRAIEIRRAGPQVLHVLLPNSSKPRSPATIPSVPTTARKLGHVRTLFLEVLAIESGAKKAGKMWAKCVCGATTPATRQLSPQAIGPAAAQPKIIHHNPALPRCLLEHPPFSTTRPVALPGGCSSTNIHHGTRCNNHRRRTPGAAGIWAEAQSHSSVRAHGILTVQLTVN